MEILPGMELVDLSLFIRKKKILVISDLHLGIEAEYINKGVLVPKTHYVDLIRKFDYIFSKVSPERIIITGDLKHEFGGISKQEWRDVLDLLDYLSKHCKKIILLKGNHDPMLGPIARKRNLEVLKEYKSGDTLFVHGDYEPELDKKIKTIITGHEHPAITLREKTKSEKFKCFLKGKYKGRNLVVLPSMNLLIEGTDVLQGQFLSPMLKMQNFHVYVVEGHDVFDFGKINKIKIKTA